MRHKLKQERKGARKEIRQDTAFFGHSKDEGSQDERSGETREDEGIVFKSCKPGRRLQENVEKEEKVLKLFFNLNLNKYLFKFRLKNNFKTFSSFSTFS